MMENRYSRNRIYLTEEEQEVIKNYPILLGGGGIGSVIAECALRLGFETITIIDGGEVELSNLNRQNYTEEDISIEKVAVMSKRLKAINSNATIKYYNCFFNKENVKGYIEGHKIAVNALGFSSEMPLIFDQECQEQGVPVLHPYNLGWGGLVSVIFPENQSLNSIAKKGEKFSELKMVEYVSSYLRFWGEPEEWIDDIIKKVKEEKEISPSPQLSIGAWLVASMATHILYNIATGKEVKKFPEFYLSTII